MTNTYQVMMAKKMKQKIEMAISTIQNNWRSYKAFQSAALAGEEEEGPDTIIIKKDRKSVVGFVMKFNVQTNTIADVALVVAKKLKIHHHSFNVHYDGKKCDSYRRLAEFSKQPNTVYYLVSSLN